MSEKIVVHDVNKLYSYGNVLKSLATQLEKDYNAIVAASKEQADNWGDRNYINTKKNIDDCVKVIRGEKEKIAAIGTEVIRLADKIKSIL